MVSPHFSRKKMADSKLLTRWPRARLHQTTILDLPDQIVADILSRLPTKTIFNSRFVCKLWNQLTTKDSYFRKLHFSRSHSEFLVQIKDALNKGVANWIDPEFDMTQGFKTRVAVKPRTQIPYTNFGLINSCCGLVMCLHRERVFDVGVICNPLTGEYLTLPKVHNKVHKEYLVETSSDDETSSEDETSSKDETWDEHKNEMVDPFFQSKYVMYCVNAYAFGYCSSTNQFKVLRIFSNKMHSSWNDPGLAEINVVGTDSWRGIGSSPVCPTLSSHPILLNEVVHWICDMNNTKKFIVYFNFESEKFGELEPPFGIVKNYQKRKDRMTMSVLGGCLAVCDVLRTGKFDIWVMKEYGVEGSWSKDFVVDTTVIKMFMRGKHRPLKVLSNGEILMLSLGDYQKYPTFVCYNPEDHAVRMLKLHRYSKFEVVAHTPSFISLKDFIMGDNLNVMNFKDGVSNIGHVLQIPMPDPSRVGRRTSPAPYIIEHCFKTVNDNQKLAD